LFLGKKNARYNRCRLYRARFTNWCKSTLAHSWQPACGNN